MSTRPPTPPHRFADGTRLAAGCLLFAVVAVGTAAPSRALPPAGRSPIVVISIDTLRSDRLPVYGYDKVQTPAIDALAKDGVLFEHAFSQIPLTLPSHLSMFSGLLPAAHGVRDNSGYHFDASRHPWTPETLRAGGYRTAGFASTFVLRPETGIAAGFESYDADIDLGTSSDLSGAQRPGRIAVGKAIEWLRTRGSDPFFLFVHLYEPHAPYQPEPPFASRYADAYDGEIATADALVGELLAELKRLGLYGRSLVLLLSDHGEGLGDHGEDEHGMLLYRETLQVPMILKLPGGARAGQRVSTPAQTIDVAPTLLAAAGLPADPRLEGVALQELSAAAAVDRPLVAESNYARLHYGWSELISVIEYPFQLIDGPDPELYDLAADPGATRNLRDTERRRFHALREIAKQNAVAPDTPTAEDTETARRLAALGYLGGVAKTAGPPVDPKSKLELLSRFRAARAEIQNGLPQQAVPTLEQLVQAAPGMIDGWLQLGDARRLLGDLEGSLFAYKQAMTLSSGADRAALGAAGVLRDLGRLGEAQQHAELALAGAAHAAYRVLAEIALADRDPAAAQAAAQGAIDNGAELGGRILLARALIASKQPERALAELDRAEQRKAALGAGSNDFLGLYSARGDAMLTLGRRSEAFDAYRLEVEEFPESELGYMSLAILLRIEGRLEEAVRVLEMMVARNPERPNAYYAAAATMLKLGASEPGARVLRLGLARFPDNAKLRSLAAGRG